MDQTYTLLYSKENHTQNKRQPTDWEKIFANNVTDKGLTFKIYEQLIQHNIKKQTHSKNGQKTMGSFPKTYR